MKARRGAALVIVLCMVVLLSTLILAFFSKTRLEHQISNSSSNQVKVDVFTQGARDQIIGDLKREIVAGSTLPAVKITTGLVETTLYQPKAASSAIPAMVGPASYTTAIWRDTLPNLVKQSTSGVPFYPALNHDANGPLRAVNVPTTANSLNDRVVSETRWNKSLLLPKNSPSGTDLRPVAAFKAPDWILVSRDGGNPATWSNALRSGNQKETVVGRYAYVIYNEGGLLDANVAGYPSNFPSRSSQNTPGGSVSWGFSYKNSPAMTDLSQLKDGSGNAYLTNAQIDSLIGWRNNASASPIGTFPGFSFSLNSNGKYWDFLLGHVEGFLSHGNTVLSSNDESDRLFTGRQQLIQFITESIDPSQKSNLQNVLQYLGTFSRSLNQPSLAPDFTNVTSPQYRKSVVDGGGSGKMGNSGFGFEASINPQFLSIRANTTVSSGRNDGSDLVQGEPLVKKRFPLNCLAWVTYKGPSSTLNVSDSLAKAYIDAGLSEDFLSKGTGGATGRIYKYFGLTWSGGSGTSGYWTYDHGVSSGGRTIIGTLADVRGQNREPDFFELLKAAIQVGSVGKSTAADNSTAGSAGRNRDQRVDFQILQIGANILDQFDADGYPLHLQMADGTTPRDFYGVENLPYLNALHSAPFVATNGLQMVLEIPSIWNPVDSASSFPTGNLAPSNFRITMVSSDPWNTVAASSNTTRVIPTYTGGTALYHVSPVSFNSRDSTAITFSTSSTLYREPTLLLQPNVPSGSNLSMASTFNVSVPTPNNPPPATTTTTTLVTATAPMVEAGSNVELVGWPVGAVPLKDGTATLTGLTRDGFGAGRTIRMEWSDGSGNWQPYQEVYSNVLSPIFEGPLATVISTWNSAAHTTMVPYDLRTTRFYPVYGQNAAKPTIKMANAAVNQLDSSRSTASMGGSWSNPTTFGFASNYAIPSASSGWAGNYFGYPGASEQNSATANFPNGAGGNAAQYYTDPDGAVRRAMGAYVPVGGTGPASTTTGLPLASPKAASSRPIMINRPFRSVGELGYVFRDTPWKNLDFFTPESGDAGLLDVFCIGPDDRPDAMVAGKIDLNSRQVPVLQAILAGASRDEFTPGSVLPASGAGSANSIATALVARTTATASNQGPLTNLSDLVGKYVNGYSNPFLQPYDGFSADAALGASGSIAANDVIQRFRETSIRALAQMGNTRVWNLLIDVVVQTGRYPQSASDPANFLVEGEMRQWIHVAIDRLTGEVIDRQIETVSE